MVEEEKLRNSNEEKRENEIKVDIQTPPNSNSSSVDSGSSQTVTVPDQENVGPEGQADIAGKSDDSIKKELIAIPPREECTLS